MRFKHESAFAEESGPFVDKFLGKTGDLFLQMKWRVKSWIPLVSRFLPSDTVTIFKRGQLMRIDTGFSISQKTVKMKGLFANVSFLLFTSILDVVFLF